jgi:hypothetical protein
MNDLNKRKVADMMTDFGIYANFRTELKRFRDGDQRLIARMLYGLRETDCDPDGTTPEHKTFEEFIKTELI